MTWIKSNFWWLLLVVAYSAAFYQDHQHPVKCYPVEQGQR